MPKKTVWCCICGDSLAGVRGDVSTGYGGEHEHSACPTHTEDEGVAYCEGDTPGYCSDCGDAVDDLDAHVCDVTDRVTQRQEVERDVVKSGAEIWTGRRAESQATYYWPATAPDSDDETEGITVYYDDCGILLGCDHPDFYTLLASGRYANEADVVLTLLREEKRLRELPDLNGE